MAAEENLGKLQVEVELATKRMDKDLEKIRKKASDVGKKIEVDFKKHKIEMDTRVAKMNLQQLQQLHKALEQQWKKKLELGTSPASIEKTRIALNSTEDAMLKLKNQTKETSSMFSKFKGLLAGVGLSVGAYRVIAFLKESIQLAGVQEQAEKKLEAALGRKSQSLLDYASALQKATTFGDEQIIQAQSLIAAFVKDENQIKKLTKATLDLASAKGMDLVSAADLISKTVGSSTNALSRYGIEVSGAVGSTERMESAVQSISKLFGGQAEAAANTYAGQMQQLNNEMGDMQERIGKELVTEVIQVTKEFRNFARELIDFNDLVKEVTGGLGIMASTIRGVKEIIKPGSFLGNQLENNVDRLATKFKLMLEAGQEINETDLTYLEKEIYKQVKALVDANKKAEEFQKTLSEIPDSFKGVDANSFKFSEILGTGEKPKKEVAEILEKINQLKDANAEGNLSLKEYQANFKKIAELEAKLDPSKVEDLRKKAIDDIIKKIKSENELKEITTGLTESILQSSKETLKTQLELAKNDEERLKLLNAISQIEDKQREISFELKAGDVPDLGADEFAKQFDKDTASDIEKETKERISAQEKLKQITINAIDEESAKRKAEIEQRFEKEKENLYLLREEELITKEQLSNAISDLERGREIELARLSQERLNNQLNTISNIGDLLINKFNIAGNTFFAQMVNSLNTVREIVTLINSINTAFSLFDAFKTIGGIAGAAITGNPLLAFGALPRAKGGPAYKNKPYLIGERGPEVFVPQSNGMVIPNNQLNKSNASTGNADVVARLLSVENAIKAMNMNLVNMNFEDNRPLNVSVNVDGQKLALINAKHTNRLIRAGHKLNER